MSVFLPQSMNQYHDMSDDSLSQEGLRPIRVLTLCTVDITLAKLLSAFMYALRKEGYIVEAACAEGDHARKLREEGFRIHVIPFKRRVLTISHLWSFIALCRLFREINYDIVHVHTPTAQVIGRLAAWFAGVPVILYTSHGFQFHESRPLWARMAIIWIERQLARRTDVLFTQSQEDRDTALENGIGTPDKVIWIGNGVSMEGFAPGPVDQTVRQEFNLRAEDKVIVFVGRIVREKGVMELAEAMVTVKSSMPEARLLIIGDTLESDGDVHAKDLFQQALEKSDIMDVVRFAGLREDVSRLLRAVDLMVLPSWREGMPRSIIEGMAVGLPVVATNIRGCREEVVHRETGLLVPPRNPMQLAFAILEVLSNSRTAEEMGKRGRQRALSLFEESKVVERQLTVYRSISRIKNLGRFHDMDHKGTL